MPIVIQPLEAFVLDKQWRSDVPPIRCYPLRGASYLIDSYIEKIYFVGGILLTVLKILNVSFMGGIGSRRHAFLLGVTLLPNYGIRSV